MIFERQGVAAVSFAPQLSCYLADLRLQEPGVFYLRMAGYLPRESGW